MQIENFRYFRDFDIADKFQKNPHFEVTMMWLSQFVMDIIGFHSFVLIKVISLVGDGVSYFLFIVHSLRVVDHSR